MSKGKRVTGKQLHAVYNLHMQAMGGYTIEWKPGPGKRGIVVAERRNEPL